MIRTRRRDILLTASAAGLWRMAAAATPEARPRLTRMFTGAVRPYDVPAGGPATYLLVLPLEAHCSAVRLGFANHLSTLSWTVRSATIQPSDSYGLAVGMALDGPGFGQGRAWPAAPTGPGRPVAVSFDQAFDPAAAETVRLDPAGSRRSLTLPPASDNPGDRPHAYTIVWSDFAPVASIPRADGGVQPLLFITVTVEPPRMVGMWFDPRFWTRNPANRGRLVCTGLAEPGGDPAALFKGDGGCPVVAVQYLSRAPGATVAISGDSLVTAPDGSSNALLRAAMDLSRPDSPIEVANMGWGGTDYAIYGGILTRNLAALAPSVVAYQPLSRNDGATMARMQGLLAHATDTAAAARARFGTVPIWFSPGCEPTFYGPAPQAQAAQAAFADIRQRLAESAQRDRIALIDGPGVIGRRELPYMYASANFSLAADIPAGAVDLPVQDGSNVPRAFPGDHIWLLAHPGALPAAAAVVAATPTTITVSSGTIAVPFARGERFGVGPASAIGHSGWTDDNVHPNEPGVEALVPAARAALTEALAAFRPPRR